uniref:Uncharacterized protein n=1 Tax=viral metagenome TaxID=1070528 RepID=A0A6C0KIU2_9ZZZZ
MKRRGNNSSKKKTKKTKKTNKKLIPTVSLLTALTNSSLLLFLFVFAALINVIILWNKQDNESLFLFILIAFITYSQNKNMIYVLGCPLLVVNILMILRKSFQHEGFSDLTGAEVNTVCKDHLDLSGANLSGCNTTFFTAGSSGKNSFKDSQINNYLQDKLTVDAYEKLQTNISESSGTRTPGNYILNNSSDAKVGDSAANADKRYEMKSDDTDTDTDTATTHNYVELIKQYLTVGSS